MTINDLKPAFHDIPPHDQLDLILAIRERRHRPPPPPKVRKKKPIVIEDLPLDQQLEALRIAKAMGKHPGYVEPREE